MMILLRALAVWLIFLVVESVNGIFRRLVLEPRVGDFSARQIGVVSGSILILVVTYLCVGWIGTKTTTQLTLIGVLWVLHRTDEFLLCERFKPAVEAGPVGVFAIA